MWQPGATLELLKSRALMYQCIRDFFDTRQVLEVETPIIGASTATDPHLESMQIAVDSKREVQAAPLFLHTSPEFPMKRLLAAGSGDIYQICKTFRQGESGPRHNPEFTMLEWYRTGFNLDQLMAEVLALVNQVLGKELDVEYLDYRELFVAQLGVDPFQVSDAELLSLCRERAGYAGSDLARDECLDLLMSVLIEPVLGCGKASFVIAYPASQASLARISVDKHGNEVAQRFELYLEGMEIANGYDELQDAREQRRRFEQDNAIRRDLDLAEIPLDEHLVSALEQGLPDCSGVALGLDRLLMVKSGASRISEVLAFDWQRR